MKERPILFGAPMVRAILAGTKTQSRRFVKHPALETCPFGQPGDRLWVREMWRPGLIVEGRCSGNSFVHFPDGGQKYRDGAYYPPQGGAPAGEAKWRPSIHMPRWASRITLEITEVRVERLQDISEQDAMAEGVEPYRLPCHPQREALRHVDGFCAVWESIYGPGSWECNPWVWAITFARVATK